MDRIEKLLSFLEQSPKDNFLRHALALEYIKAGEPAKAEELFKAILSESPDYTGSYYHLAKLVEAMSRTDEAIDWYKKGMETALTLNDRHSYNELRSAYDELTMD